MKLVHETPSLSLNFLFPKVSNGRAEGINRLKRNTLSTKRLKSNNHIEEIETSKHLKVTILNLDLIINLHFAQEINFRSLATNDYDLTSCNLIKTLPT